MSNASKRNAIQKAAATKKAATPETTPAVVETPETTPAAPCMADLVCGIADRYKELPPLAAQVLSKADLIREAKKRADLTKAEVGVLRKADALTIALNTMGHTVERPKIAHTQTRVPRTSNGTAKIVDLNAPEVKAILATHETLDKIKRADRTPAQQKEWAIGYRILLNARKASGDYTARGGRGVSHREPAESRRLWMPIVPVVETCQRCAKKPSTMRVVDHDARTTLDACNGCGLTVVSTERNDKGHTVTLMNIRDGAVVVPAAYAKPKDETPVDVTTAIAETHDANVAEIVETTPVAEIVETTPAKKGKGTKGTKAAQIAA